jgi:hypothetical protein
MTAVDGPFPEREDPAACHFCGRSARDSPYWPTVTLHHGGIHTHTTLIGVPRCAGCRRRNRVLVSAAIAGYCALVLAAAFFGASLAVDALGQSGDDARDLSVIAIVAVLFAGLMSLVIAVPIWQWRCYRNDPEVAWWRDQGWHFSDHNGA